MVGCNRSKTQLSAHVCFYFSILDAIISCLVTFVSVCYDKLSCHYSLYSFIQIIQNCIHLGSQYSSQPM